MVGTDKTQFFFHYNYLNETISQSFGRDQVGWYIVKVANPAEADDVAKRMDALFANSPAETKTATEKAFVADFAKQVGDIGAIMTGIAAVVIIFILFVAGNAMAQSIRERTNELAILKTLGFNDRKVLGMVLLESTLVALLGGCLGSGPGLGGDRARRSDRRAPADLPLPAEGRGDRHRAGAGARPAGRA